MTPAQAIEYQNNAMRQSQCLSVDVSKNKEAKSMQSNENIKLEFEQTLTRLRSFLASKNLDGLEQAADEIENKWREKEEEYYLALMMNVCSLLSSADFNDYSRQVSLVKKYISFVLEKLDMIPLETELQMLLHLQGEVEQEAVKEEERSKQRSEKVKLWFHAWHRLETETDRNFDPYDRPLRNVPLPLKVSGLRAGVSPEYIQDPELRAEYEAAIAKNIQKTENYNWQQKLRELNGLFLPRIEAYIVKVYSSPPFALDELKQYLDIYIKDEDIKARILNSVRQKIL